MARLHGAALEGHQPLLPLCLVLETCLHNTCYNFLYKKFPWIWSYHLRGLLQSGVPSSQKAPEAVPAKRCHDLCFLFVFWLCWVFVAVLAFSLAVARRGYSLVAVLGFLTVGPLLLQNTGSRCMDFSSCSMWPQ